MEWNQGESVSPTSSVRLLSRKHSWWINVYSTKDCYDNVRSDSQYIDYDDKDDVNSYNGVDSYLECSEDSKMQDSFDSIPLRIDDTIVRRVLRNSSYGFGGDT